MEKYEVIRAWGNILMGRKPSLSIEVTRECPLRCPGCYAYEEDHVSSGVNLRQLIDKKGESLIEGVLALVEEHDPLHVSIVGGDPLVRYRELNVLLPVLSRRGIHVQLVTSAFREIPMEWISIPNLNVVISIDGLQPEHDIRRKPATYSRILQNIAGRLVSIHCTITAQMMQKPGYLEEFVRFWSEKSEIKRIWMSMFTPQKGDSSPEVLSPQQRVVAVEELLRLRLLYSKLDMKEAVVREFLAPPSSPDKCIFAQTTHTISADLQTRIEPCQFGGNPDCSQCGCMASMGLAAVGHYELGMGVTAGRLFQISAGIGNKVKSLKRVA